MSLNPRQQAIQKYIKFVQEDPEYQRFIEDLTMEFWATGLKPDVPKRFKEWHDKRYEKE